MSRVGPTAYETPEAFEMEEETFPEVAPEAPQAEEPADSLLARVFTVQLVITVLCLACIVASTSLTSVLGDLTCDDALGDTRDSGARALGSCAETAETSLTGTVDRLLNFASSGVTGVVAEFLSQGESSVTKIVTGLEGHYGRVDKNSTAFINSLTSPLWHGMKAELASPVLKNAAMQVVAGDRSVTIGPLGRQSRPGLWTVMNYGHPMLGLASESVPVTGLMLGGENLERVAWSPQLNQDVLLAKALVRPGETKWLGVVTLAGEFLGYPIVHKLADPAGSVDTLLATVFFSILGVRDFLAKTVQDLQVNSTYHAPDMFKVEAYDHTNLTQDFDDISYNTVYRNHSALRVYTCMASSWISDTLRAAGDPKWAKADQTFMLTGASEGDVMSLQFGWDSVTQRNLTQLMPIPDINATDPLIAAVAKEIHSYQNGTRSGYAVLEGGLNTLMIDGNEYYTTVTRYNNGRGIDWWIVVTLETEVVLREVRANKAAATARLAADEEHLAEAVERQRWELRGWVALVAAALLILSIFITGYALRPIKEVQAEMKEVADMKLDRGVVKAASMFAEVRQMQRDFLSMVASLKEFRAYLPDSLLTEEESALRVPPPKGNVAILFTDIQSSTALWKQSPMDMNVALELHNDIIREQCTAHGGYEVKTIGDAFMISFSDPVQAAKMALSVLKALADAQWPRGLVLPEAGMVIRVGINHGDVIAEENPVTGRVDYRGTPVNMAARVEAKAKGGTLCVAHATYALLEPHLAALGHPATGKHGKHDLKGLGGEHELHLLAPQGCETRFTDASNCKQPVVDVAEVSQEIRAAESGSHYGSGGDSVISFSGRPKEAKRGKTGVGLEHSMMTVAVVDVLARSDQTLMNAVSMVLWAVLARATETDGTMAYVTGERMMVAWNTTKPVRQHTLAGVRFTSLLGERMRHNMVVGLATGSGLYGNIGNHKARYTTTLGAPVKVAEALVQLARGVKAFCLVGNVSNAFTQDMESVAKPAMRLIDSWYEPVAGFVARIHQLDHVVALRAFERWGLDQEEQEADLGDNNYEHFTQLVQAALEDPDQAASVADSLVLLCGGEVQAENDAVCMHAVSWLRSVTKVALGARGRLSASAPRVDPMLDASVSPRCSARRQSVGSARRQSVGLSPLGIQGIQFAEDSSVAP